MIAALLMATTVAIDVGHTPKSPGSISAAGVPEHSYNLDMAERVEAWLHRYGIGTRRVDPRSGNDLAGRARQAAGADLLVSIHHDSSACAVAHLQGLDTAADCRTADGRIIPISDISGYSVWVSGRNADYRRSLRCGMAVSHSLRSGGAHPALFHGWTLPQEGRDMLTADGLYRRDGLAVVSVGSTPAILVETAVTANPAEERWRRRPEVADAIAAFVAKGVAACLNRSPQK